MSAKVILHGQGKKVELSHQASLSGPSGPAATERAVFTIRHRQVKYRWLHYGGMPSNLNGYPLIRDSTLVAALVSAGNQATGTVHIRKNDEEMDLVTMVLTGQKMKKVIDLNIPVNAGDRLQIYVEAPGGIDYPEIILDLNDEN